MHIYSLLLDETKVVFVAVEISRLFTGTKEHKLTDLLCEAPSVYNTNTPVTVTAPDNLVTSRPDLNLKHLVDWKGIVVVGQHESG